MTSELDRVVLIAATAKHGWSNAQTGESISWDDLQPRQREWALQGMRAALDAAQPLIEQRVRKEISDVLEIKAYDTGAMADSFMNGGETYAAAASAYSDAARIARSGAKR